MHFEEFKDILIVDQNGKILYYNIGNLGFFDLKPEELIGKKVTMLYENLNDENSSLMRAVRYNEASLNYVQELETSKGRWPQQVSNTFPVTDGVNTVGAIEFAYYNEKESVSYNSKKANLRKSKNNINETQYELDDIVTNHESIHRIKAKVQKISKMDSPVLICGNTGTGKEILAQAIHNTSKRRSGPFVSVNCGALPETLLESLLFGTTKGSYTDAEDRPGIFEISQNGTLFLDEINSLPLALQAKILKAIEDKSIRRVGGFDEIFLDVRIIAACNVKSDELLKKNQLRQDLYFRLSVIQLELPDLIERENDIIILANYFIDENNRIYHRNIGPLSKEVGLLLTGYNWPGNVRELRNVIESAFHKTQSNYIQPENLPKRFRFDSAMEIALETSLNDLLESEEKEIILKSLRKHRNNLRALSDELKMSQQALKYKLNKYKIEI